MGKKRFRRNSHHSVTEGQSHSGREMYGGYGAALSFGAGVLYWPTLDKSKEISNWDLEKIWRHARALDANSGLCGKAVQDVVDFIGWLVPHACSSDKAWNDEADRVFMSRSINPDLFDVAGELNFYTAQIFTERQRVVDGDCLTVWSQSVDDGAAFGFYTAPQVSSPADDGDRWNNGVLRNAQGRVMKYGIKNFDTGDVVKVWSQDALLYRHNMGGGSVRGLTDLHRAIRHLHDEAELISYVKQSAKLGAAIGLVQTSSPQSGPTMGGGNIGKTAVNEQGERVETLMGAPNIVKLPPGMDMKVLSDNRPSPNVMALIRHLMDEIAYGVGLTPALVWDPDKLGSGGIRFVMSKLKRWIKVKHAFKRAWCMKVWRYTIAKEIKLGRLRLPDDPNWFTSVKFSPMSDMTIDLGREGNLMINLVDSGLADQDDWCLSNWGLTYEEVVRNKAKNTAMLHEVCAEYGLKPDQVVPGTNRGGIARESDIETMDRNDRVDESMDYHAHE